MKRLILALSTVAALTLLSAGLTVAGTVVVPGTSNPFLAGMPSGSACCNGDTAPAESPVYAGAVTAGTTLTFTGVTGGVSYAGGTPTDGPNGNSGYLIDTLAYEGVSTINNIAGFTNAPADALVGVFLNASLPTFNAAPAVLDFSTPTSTPQLQQIFFIGDGSLGAIAVPTGATRLFLGTVDGYGWYNDTGAIDLTVNGLSSGVPEPATWAMLLVAFAGLAAALRSRRKQVATDPALSRLS